MKKNGLEAELLDMDEPEKLAHAFAAMLPETSAARQRRHGGLPQGTYINEKPNGVTFPSSPFGLFILLITVVIICFWFRLKLNNKLQ